MMKGQVIMNNPEIHIDPVTKAISSQILIDGFFPANSIKTKSKVKIEDFYPCEDICSHCLELGYWEDEDKCPKCSREGHTSPWRVGSCKKCQEIYDKGWKDMLKKIGR